MEKPELDKWRPHPLAAALVGLTGAPPSRPSLHYYRRQGYGWGEGQEISPLAVQSAKGGVTSVMPHQPMLSVLWKLMCLLKVRCGTPLRHGKPRGSVMLSSPAGWRLFGRTAILLLQAKGSFHRPPPALDSGHDWPMDRSHVLVIQRHQFSHFKRPPWLHKTVQTRGWSRALPCLSSKHHPKGKLDEDLGVQRRPRRNRERNGQVDGTRDISSIMIMCQSFCSS